MASVIMNTSAFQKSWARDFDEIFFDNYIKVPAQGVELINEQPAPQQHFVKKGMFVTLGPAKEMREGGAIQFDSFVDGPTKTVYPTKFGIALQCTYESMKDDRNDLIKQSMAKVGESVKYTIELKQADLFNSAFGTSRLGLDGEPLCFATHPYYAYGANTTSNLITGALSKTTLQAAIDLFTTLLDERGKPMIMMPKILVIPPQLEWKAKELLLSEYDPSNANRAVNPFTTPQGNGSNFAGGVQYIVYRFLTSSTAWFLMSEKDMADLQWYWFDEPTSRTYTDDNTDNMIFKSTFRAVNTFWNWRGVVGSSGV